jgi:hypothetical protein
MTTPNTSFVIEQVGSECRQMSGALWHRSRQINFPDTAVTRREYSCSEMQARASALIPVAKSPRFLAESLALGLTRNLVV